VAVRQIGYAPVVRMQALSADGRPIPMQTGGQGLQGRPEVEVRFDSPQDQPLVFVPDQERFFTLLFESNCGAGGPAIHIYEIGQVGAERQLLATVRGSAEVPAGDIRLVIGISYVPFLRADYRPGMGVAVGALAVVLVMLVVGWAWPARLIWLSVLPAGDDTSRIHLLAPPGARAHRWLESLIGQLQEAEDDDG
jgi:hypothetical protein